MLLCAFQKASIAPMICPHNWKCVYWGFLFAEASVDWISLFVLHIQFCLFFLLVLCLHCLLFDCRFLCVHWVRLQLWSSRFCCQRFCCLFAWMNFIIQIYHTVLYSPHLPTSVSFLDHSAGTDHEFKMTCHLKIAAKLIHPSFNAAPLWPDNHPSSSHWSLHPSWNASYSHCTFHSKEWANSPVN